MFPPVVPLFPPAVPDELEEPVPPDDPEPLLTTLFSPASVFFLTVFFILFVPFGLVTSSCTTTSSEATAGGAVTVTFTSFSVLFSYLS